MSEEVYLKGKIIAVDEVNDRKLFVFGKSGELSSMYVKSNLLLSREDLSLTDLKTVDAMIQAAYKAGKESKPLMVALNALMVALNEEVAND